MPTSRTTSMRAKIKFYRLDRTSRVNEEYPATLLMRMFEEALYSTYVSNRPKSIGPHVESFGEFRSSANVAALQRFIQWLVVTAHRAAVKVFADTLQHAAFLLLPDGCVGSARPRRIPALFSESKTRAIEIQRDSEKETVSTLAGSQRSEICSSFNRDRPKLLLKTSFAG